MDVSGTSEFVVESCCLVSTSKLSQMLLESYNKIWDQLGRKAGPHSIYSFYRDGQFNKRKRCKKNAFMWHFPGFNEMIMLQSVFSSNKNTMVSLNCQCHELHIPILQQVPAAA